MKRILLMLSLFLCSLYANDYNQDLGEENSYVNHLGSASADVAGCVNAITGDFYISDVDLVVAGNEPLRLERHYSSSCHEKGSCCFGWNWNHGGRMNEERGSGFACTVTSPRGSKLKFSSKKSAPTREPLLLDKSCIKKGATNASRGKPSARTHIKNLRFFYSKMGPHYLKDGGGTHWYFHGKGGWSTESLIGAICKRQGHMLAYRYHGNVLKSIAAYAGYRTLIGKVEIELKGEVPKVATASNGSCAHYHLSGDYVFDKKQYLLKKVVSDTAPPQSYSYLWNSIADGVSCPRLEKVSQPNGRCQRVQYYKQGKNQVGNEKRKVESYSDLRIGRVAALYAPVGSDATPLLTHRFFYSLDDKKGKAGTTRVLNAYNNQKNYTFAHRKLVEVTNFGGFGANWPYSYERYFWGHHDTPQAADLLTYGVADNKGTYHFLRHYVYDEAGNICIEQTYGNLTGSSSGAPTVSANKVPVRNGSDRYEKRYSYYDRGHNLKKSECDGRKTIIYNYDFERELPISAMVMVDGAICERAFYFYDEQALLVEEVVDDGTSEDYDDLTDVTERRIKRIVPCRPLHCGLPAEVTQGYWDCDRKLFQQTARTVYHYTDNGKVAKEERYDGNDQYVGAIEKSYDHHGNVTQHIDILGHSTRYCYDANDNCIEKVGPRSGYVERYRYDFSNRLVTKTACLPDGSSYSNHYSYSYTHKRLSETDFSGNITRYQYDHMQRLAATLAPESTQSNGSGVARISRYEYDIMGRLTKQCDANGNVTETTYSAWGAPLTVKQPNGTLEKKFYNCDGTLEREVRGNGTSTTYSYDYKRRPTAVSIYSAEGERLSHITKRYNAFHLVSEQDNGGYTTHYQYDGAGRLTMVRRGERETRYGYDARGNRILITQVISEYDALVTRKVYDALNRVIEERVENGSGELQSRVGYRYDCDGNKTHLIRYSDAGVSTTVTQYDALGRVVAVTDPEGHATVTHYDHHYTNVHGETVLAITTVDPMGVTTLQIHDPAGNVAEVIRTNSYGVLLQRFRQDYDGNNALVRRLDDRIIGGQIVDVRVTLWDYTCCNQVARIVQAAGSSDEQVRRYRYDALQRRIAEIKPDGTCLHSHYDQLSRLSRYYGSDGTIDYRYVYDVLDHPIEVHNGVDGTLNRRHYDLHGRVTMETQAHGHTLSYRHDRVGRIIAVSFPDGTILRNRYSGSRLISVAKESREGHEHYCHRYSYDLAGHITEQKGIANAGTTHCHYDLLGRMRALSHPQWSEALTQFDPAGNLLAYSFSDGSGSCDESYAYDDLCQLTAERGDVAHSYSYDSLYNRRIKDGNHYTYNLLNQVVEGEKKRYHYDANGNLIAEEENAAHYSYDACNRLIAVVTDDEKVTYQYDAFNRRLGKVFYRKEAGEWRHQSKEHYLYLDQNEVGQVDTAGRFITFRLLGKGLGAEIAAAVAIESDGVLYAPLHDHNGNLRCLVDAKCGAAVQYYRYSGYGEERVNGSEPPLVAWRFSSKRHDPETGWIFFGRRHYSPQLGRWTTPDPANYTDGPNLYAYVHNNPLTHFDLYGLYESDEYGASNDVATLSSEEIDYPALLRRVAEAVHYPFECAGVALETVGHHVFVGKSRTVFKGSGRILQGKSFLDPDDDKVVNSGYAGDRSTGRLSITTHTGILTSEAGCRQFGEQLSERINGGEVFWIGSATHGFASDLFDVVIQKIGLPTFATMEMARLKEERYQEKSALHSDVESIDLCHSRGALDNYLISLNQPSERRARQTLRNIGGAISVPDLDFKHVGNIANDNDLVPKTDVWSFFRSDVKIEKTGYSSGGITSLLRDHLIESPGYQETLDRIGGEILKWEEQ